MERRHSQLGHGSLHEQSIIYVIVLVFVIIIIIILLLLLFISLDFRMWLQFMITFSFRLKERTGIDYIDGP